MTRLLLWPLAGVACLAIAFSSGNAWLFLGGLAAALFCALLADRA